MIVELGEIKKCLL